MKLNEPNILKVRLHRLFLERKVRPLRVMVTGDWHVSPIVSEKQFEYLKEAVVQADPDVIILQGDLVDSPIELRRETSLRKLLRQLKLCAGVAPTVLVLGSHDYITPTKPAKVMERGAIRIWQKICKRCGVRLLLNEWFDEVPGLRIFGAFQDMRCILRKNKRGELVHHDLPEGFATNLREIEEVLKTGLEGADDTRASRKSSIKAREGVEASVRSDIYWFAAHAPLLNKEVVEMLRSFDVASFGHTHGGIVPVGMDEIFDRLHLHNGLISPDILPLPRKARGMMPISDSTMMLVNPGMVGAQFCMPKVFQNMNFVKAAEVSVVEVAAMGEAED